MNQNIKKKNAGQSEEMEALKKQLKPLKKDILIDLMDEALTRRKGGQRGWKHSRRGTRHRLVEFVLKQGYHRDDEWASEVAAKVAEVEAKKRKDKPEINRSIFKVGNIVVHCHHRHPRFWRVTSVNKVVMGQEIPQFQVSTRGDPRDRHYERMKPGDPGSNPPRMNFMDWSRYLKELKEYASKRVAWEDMEADEKEELLRGKRKTRLPDVRPWHNNDGSRSSENYEVYKPDGVYEKSFDLGM